MTELQSIKIALQTLISLGVAKKQEDLGKLLGYSSASSFSQVVNGKVPLPNNFIKKLIDLHPDIKNLFETTEKQNQQFDTDKDKDKIIELLENSIRDKEEIIQFLKSQLATKSTQDVNADNPRPVQR